MTTEDALKELLKKIWEAWTIFEGLLKTLKLETGSYGTLCKAAKDHSTSRRSNWDVKWPVSIMSHHMSRHVMKSHSATAMPLPCRHPTRLSVVPLIAVVISLSHLVTNSSMENWCHSILTHLRSNVVILPHIRLSSKSWDEISLPTTIDKKPEIVD